MLLLFLCEDVSNLHGYISGKTANMVRKRPGSESVVYGLNVPRMPSMINTA